MNDDCGVLAVDTTVAVDFSGSFVCVSKSVACLMDDDDDIIVAELVESDTTFVVCSEKELSP